MDHDEVPSHGFLALAIIATAGFVITSMVVTLGAASVVVLAHAAGL